MSLFNKFAEDRQIIVNTHSPYFIDISSIVNGATLYRAVKNSEGNIDVFMLSDVSRKALKGFLKNINQPHILGTDAKEILFLEDRIIFTEGQEDVIMYDKASETVQIPINGYFLDGDRVVLLTSQRLQQYSKTLDIKRLWQFLMATSLRIKPSLSKIFRCMPVKLYLPWILEISLKSIRKPRKE